MIVKVFYGNLKIYWQEGEVIMIYELKHFDKTVLKFSAVDNSNEPDIKITWIDDDKTLLPLDLDVSDEGLYKWLKHRTIPSNRAYVRNFLSKCERLLLDR